MKFMRNYWVIFAGPVVTLTITPDLTFDALNVSKLMALGLFAGFAFTEIILQKNKFEEMVRNQYFIISTIFIIGLLVPLFFTKSPIEQQIYGVSGRNLGFLHYFYLTIILLGASLIGTAKRVHQVLLALTATGILEATYGLLQLSGHDPVSWKNPDRWTFGSFGNPNFLSSFLALSTISSIYFALKYKSRAVKSLFISFSVFQFLVILLSNSSQGILLVSLGIYLITQFYAFTKSRILGISFLVCGIFMTLISIFGILQKGPLSIFLYQDSVSYRGDYWRAGISMFKKNWIHGVGLDSYGDYYRLYRDTTAANRRGLDVVSNSAHNLFIDLAATGGVLLLISYISLLAIVLFSIINTFRKRSVLSLEYRFLAILWILFNVQTFISINVPGVAVWGWLFSGLILSASKEGFNEAKGKRVASKGENSKHLISLLIFPLIYVALVVPAFSREVSLKKAMNLNNVREIYVSANMFPKDSVLMTNIANAFEKANVETLAYDLFREATELNPNRIEAWLRIYDSPLSNSKEKNLAKNAILKLDPNLVLE